jgi:ribosomal protein L35
MKQKTNKTVKKRFTVTSKGKLLHRKGGKNHFNSREPGKVTRNKRRDETMSHSYEKNIKTLIANF